MTELERDGTPGPTADTTPSDRAAELLKGLSDVQRLAFGKNDGLSARYPRGADMAWLLDRLGVGFDS